jgi:hypothetical protein
LSAQAEQRSPIERTGIGLFNVAFWMWRRNFGEERTGFQVLPVEDTP